MIKRNLNKTSYIFNGYIVTIARTHTTKDGAPMYSADITNLKNAEHGANCGANTYNYSFKGHFDTECNEAIYILLHHCKNVVRDKTTAQYIYINYNFN